MTSTTQPDSSFTGNAADSATVAEPVRRVKIQDLFQHARELEIDHDGRIYRLRLTQHNRLILTA